MSQLNDREFEALEAELRRYKPRTVDPLSVSSPFFAGTLKWMAAAAAIALAAGILWFVPRNHGHDHPIARTPEPLTQIQAEAAMARGANMDELAPLPVVSHPAHGISALDVLSQE